jgi:hypothetical protein
LSAAHGAGAHHPTAHCYHQRGKPVARLVPVDEEMPSIFGRMRGTVTIHGDIVGPTGEEWNAQKGILYVGEDEG